MKSHIVDEVEGALRAAEVLQEVIRKVLFALKNMPDNGARKSYLKAITSSLDADVNLVKLRVNNAKEKLIKHELV